MGREIKRAMDHWVFEGKSNIAVIYRRESLRMGQSLSKNSGAQPANRACLRRASLPSSGWLLSLSQHAEDFLGAVFGLYNAKESFLPLKPKLHFQLLLMLCGGCFGPMLPSFWILTSRTAGTPHKHNFQCKLQFKMKKTWKSVWATSVQ